MCLLCYVTCFWLVKRLCKAMCLVTKYSSTYNNSIKGDVYNLNNYYVYKTMICEFVHLLSFSKSHNSCKYF